MTPFSSKHRQSPPVEAVTMVASVATQSLAHKGSMKKRGAPLVESAVVRKKRRSLVTRTHSPKRQDSPSTVAFAKHSGPASLPKLPTLGQRHWYDVRKLSPTVNGVTEAARRICNGELVVIPTETVYMTCSSIVSNPRKEALTSSGINATTFETSTSHPELGPILLLKRPFSTLEGLVSFMHMHTRKPYAIKEKDGQPGSLPVVVFSEQKEVLKRITKNFWPGPLIVFLNVEDNSNHQDKNKNNDPNRSSSSLPLHTMDGVHYVGVSNSSHPLTNRFLKEVASENRIVVAVTPTIVPTSSSTPRATSTTATTTTDCAPPTPHNNIKYMTKADDVCAHYSSQRISATKATTTDAENQMSTPVHVLNGEDKRELFSVPTCQYGTPFDYSLWINGSTRTVFIRGTNNNRTPIRSDDNTKAMIVRAMLSTSSSATTTPPTTTTTGTSCRSSESSIGSGSSLNHQTPMTEKNENSKWRNRNRVMTAVLRQWKVVDLRLTIPAATTTPSISSQTAM